MEVEVFDFDAYSLNFVLGFLVPVQALWEMVFAISLVKFWGQVLVVVFRLITSHHRHHRIQAFLF